jgi:hypothetical protein
MPAGARGLHRAVLHGFFTNHRGLWLVRPFATAPSHWLALKIRQTEYELVIVAKTAEFCRASVKWDKATAGGGKGINAYF